MKHLFYFIFIFCFTSVEFTLAQKKVEGIITYTYKSYGTQAPFETYLKFDEKGAWYSRHQKKETIEAEESIKYYYYKEYDDWYFRRDSVYYFRKGETFPPFFGRWAMQPPIAWEITDETQTIAGFVARKAIAKSFIHGKEFDTEYRDVIAWFITDIPLNYGPDGYCGLPGLIVKLEYPDFGVYKTTLKSIEYKEIEDWELPSIAKKIEVNRDEAYNPMKLGKKWFKKKQKELGY